MSVVGNGFAGCGCVVVAGVGVFWFRFAVFGI